MTLEVVGLLVMALFAVLALDAYRSNARADASWERMRRDLTPRWTPPPPVYDPKALFVGIGPFSTSTFIRPHAIHYGYAHQVINDDY